MLRQRNPWTLNVDIYVRVREQYMCAVLWISCMLYHLVPPSYVLCYICTSLTRHYRPSVGNCDSCLCTSLCMRKVLVVLTSVVVHVDKSTNSTSTDVMDGSTVVPIRKQVHNNENLLPPPRLKP